MVLNTDCFRDILKYIEKHCIYEDTDRGRKMHNVSYNEICKASELSEYDNETKHYTITKLFEGNFINGHFIPQNKPETFTHAYITSLTLQGHSVLDNIKNDTIWKKTKNMLKGAGGVSLEVLVQTVYGIANTFASSIMEGMGNS